MVDFLLNPLFWVAIIFAFVLYSIIRSIFDKQKVKQQRQASSIHCHHCGAPMLESDVFCENCWKITPKVQEMLDSHPDRNPEFYSNLNYKNNNHCPHCKDFYRNGRTIDSTLSLGVPIQYCSQCHQYFLDSWLIEWSVSSFFVKSELFSSIGLWVHLLLIPAPFCCFAYKNWYALLGIMILSTICFSSRLIWYKTEKKKKIHESYTRLSQNPEYPKILIDMGFVNRMDKKYYHLSKKPVVSLKDKVKTILKDAFTFDSSHHP